MSSGDSDPPIASLIRTEAASRPVLAGRVLRDSTEEIASTGWVRLQTLSYKLPHDEDDSFRVRKWDMATRTTKKRSDKIGDSDWKTSEPEADVDDIDAHVNADAVAVIARVTMGDGVPRLLLVKQYRPAVDAVTVEFPAGLIDEGETPSQAALRELREETGFLGNVTAVHPPTPLSPGLSDESVVLVEVDVQGAKKPLPQQLDSSENIHVISVPLARLSDALRYMQKHQGVYVMHAVSTFAVGISCTSFRSSSS